MQTVSSYGVEIRKQNIPIRQTLEIYRQAVSYLTEIYEQVWAELKMIPEAKKRFNAAEHLIHTTKKNHAHFDFDIRFPKMPSYLRRAAIQHALGSVSSYESRMEQWEAAGELSGKPNFTCENHASFFAASACSGSGKSACRISSITLFASFSIFLSKLNFFAILTSSLSYTRRHASC